MASTAATRRVPYVFDSDFVLYKLWPTHTFPPMQRRGVKHKRTEESDKNNKRRSKEQEQEGEEEEQEDDEDDEEPQEQQPEQEQPPNQEQEPQSLHQQKQQSHQESHEKYIKSHRAFALTKGLVVAVVKGVQRVMTDGLVPEESKLDPKELEIQLIQRFLQTFGYEFSLPETQQALADTEKLHDLLLTLDAQSRKVVRRSDYVLGGDNLSMSSACKESVREFNDRTSRSWFAEAKDPFAHMKFTHSPSVLFQCKRQRCPSCAKSSHLYCCNCLRATIPDEFLPPPVQLPVRFDIIHHPQENIHKSTSVHACVLSPQKCALLKFPAAVPEYSASDTVLLYPTDDAVFLQDLEPEFVQSIARVVVIESTWQKGNVVASHPHLQPLRKIKLQGWESTFWRYQELGRHFLSTLEAIYYTSIELVNAKQRHNMDEPEETRVRGSPELGVYEGEFDDLLYFYAHNHAIIVRRVEGEADKQKPPPRSWKPIHDV